jgi:hypothetical protein
VLLLAPIPLLVFMALLFILLNSEFKPYSLFMIFSWTFSGLSRLLHFNRSFLLVIVTRLKPLSVPEFFYDLSECIIDCSPFVYCSGMEPYRPTAKTMGRAL